jgi:hypothetical protein
MNDAPEPVRCDECDAISAPMFRDNRGFILCGGCTRKEHPEFEWPQPSDTDNQ